MNRIYPFQVALPATEPAIGLSVDSKGQAEQIRSIDVSRLGGRLGTLPPALLRRLDDALRLHLTL
jgi:mRNA interferase MazF